MHANKNQKGEEDRGKGSGGGLLGAVDTRKARGGGGVVRVGQTRRFECYADSEREITRVSTGRLSLDARTHAHTHKRSRTSPRRRRRVAGVTMGRYGERVSNERTTERTDVDGPRAQTVAAAA